MKNILKNITESEKERILEMHRNAIRKNLVNEQAEPTSSLGATAAGNQTTTQTTSPTQNTTTNQTTQRQGPQDKKVARNFGGVNYLLTDITSQDKLNLFRTVSANDITILNKVPFTDKTVAAKNNPKLTETIMSKYVYPGLSALLDIHAQLGVSTPYKSITELKDTIEKYKNSISPNSMQSALDLISVSSNKGKENDLYSQYKTLLNSRVAALKTPTQTGQ